METLTLEQLAPYLPFRLKLSNNLFPEDINILSGLVNGIYFIDDINHAYGDICNCKPLLRNLSDLTKEIEHNGERFVPIEKLNGNGIYDTSKGMKIYLDELTVRDYQKLLSWHFDVLGLIEKGHAIDINQIK